MKSNGTSNGTSKSRFSLERIREATPPVDPVEAVRGSLQAALLSRIGETDMETIAEGIVSRAKNGDAKAIDTLLKIVASGPKPQTKQVHEAELVMVESVGSDQLRKLCALSIKANKAMSLAGLSGLTGLDDAKLRALLKHDWFESNNGYYSLTPEGRQAI